MSAPVVSFLAAPALASNAMPPWHVIVRSTSNQTHKAFGLFNPALFAKEQLWKEGKALTHLPVPCEFCTSWKLPSGWDDDSNQILILCLTFQIQGWCFLCCDFLLGCLNSFRLSIGFWWFPYMCLTQECLLSRNRKAPGEPFSLPFLPFVNNVSYLYLNSSRNRWKRTKSILHNRGKPTITDWKCASSQNPNINPHPLKIQILTPQCEGIRWDLWEVLRYVGRVLMNSLVTL